MVERTLLKMPQSESELNSHSGCRIFNNERSTTALSISDANRRARPPIVAILELTDSAAVQCLGSDCYLLLLLQELE